MNYLFWRTTFLLVLATLLLSAKTACAQDLQTGSGPANNDRLWPVIGLDETAHFAQFRHPVKVAIIDDGFDLNNPLWAASIAHNAREIPGNEIDDDHNGKIDDYAGWDFGDNDADVRPSRELVNKESHGTRVLGVFWEVLRRLSASTPEGITILPIKAVSDGHLNNYLKEGYKGIEYAIEQKADVIICSWSGPLISAEEKAIVARAHEKGILIVAAAGNFYALQPMYPGAISSVIDVAATTYDGHKLSVSNYGSFVDISAPGDSILTYDPYSSEAGVYLSGTSAATPVVGAIVTAIRASRPELGAAAIERMLKNTATPVELINPHYAGTLGAGIVNVKGIRDGLDGGVSAGGSSAGGAAAGVGFVRPQGYIDLAGLEARRPIRVVPYGRYPGIKFVLSSSGVMGPDIRATLFREGRQTDTIIRGQALRYPFLACADSVYFYSAGGRPTAHNYWYYSAMPIDSSTYYCGGTVDLTVNGEGWLGDGSRDANYTGRNDCKWQLTAPPGKRILLDFPQFDTEPRMDQVYLFNGNSTKDPILAIFSGHKLPPPIKSWDNSVLVWWITNDENNFQGWKLHYKVVDADPAPQTSLN